MENENNDDWMISDGWIWLFVIIIVSAGFFCENYWKGLMREHAVIEMKDGKVIGFSEPACVCLFKYKSPIVF